MRLPVNAVDRGNTDKYVTAHRRVMNQVAKRDVRIEHVLKNLVAKGQRELEWRRVQPRAVEIKVRATVKVQHRHPLRLDEPKLRLVRRARYDSDMLLIRELKALDHFGEVR